MSKKRKKGRQRQRQPSPLRSIEGVPTTTPDGVDGEDAWQGDAEAAAGDRTGRVGGAERGLRSGPSSGRTRTTAGRPTRRTSPSRRGGRGGGPQEPQPPILAPLARSLALVGTSPLILGTAFLSVLVIWLIYSSSGIIRIASPATMAQIQSLIPLHSLLDLQFLLAGLRVFPPVLAIGLGLVLVPMVRAAFLSLLLALIIGALDTRVRPAGWQDELRIAGRRAYSVFQFVFAIEAGMIVAVYALSSILGAFFGALGLVLALIAETYLLTLSPIVAATERVGGAAAVRLSVRAARLPGRQHLTLAFVYVFAALYIVLGLRGSPAAPATPTVAVWAYVLFATYLHVSVLAALTYRWLLVRGVVGADEERERATAPRSRRTAPR